jgi:AraC-like DNA-binding protein
MIQNFTTKAANRLERSRQWCSLTKAERIEFEDDREASIRGGQFGHLRLFLVSMGSHRVVQSHAARNAPAEPTLKFLFQEDGSALVRQGGREHLIQAGQWCALRKDIHFEMDAPAHSRQLCITLPCGVVPNPGRGIDWWRKPRNFLRGPAQILHASATATVLAGGMLSEDDCELLGLQLAQMIDMTLRTEDNCPVLRDLREERRRAILEYIDRNLADPELGVTGIARAFDCSSRTIHKLFEGEAHTVGRAIWERRLERCRDELIDPAIARSSITEIAHLWGFSDSQHFSRAFRHRFGMTPREYRSLHMLH